MATPTEIARRFAYALDAEDYATAESLLSEQCGYLCRGQAFEGPAEIIALYRDIGDAAVRDFDSIKYESDVSEVSESRALIHFKDHLSHQHQQLTFECEQLIEVDANGLITRIEHRDLPGQRESLGKFLRQFGIGESGDE